MVQLPIEVEPHSVRPPRAWTWTQTMLKITVYIHTYCCLYDSFCLQARVLDLIPASIYL